MPAKKFKKGSPEAKAFMAKLRKMRGKKVGAAKDTRQTGSSVKARDKKIQAKAPGKRIVKTGRNKSHVYYERRANRSDKGKLLGVGMFDTTTINSLDDLKKQYFKLAKKYHPDAGGTTSQFQQLQKQYDELMKKILRGSSLSSEEQKNEEILDVEIRNVIDQLITLEGINIEVIGKWLWISGNTYPVRTALKQAGLIFVKKQGQPYWVYKGVESKSRGKMEMDEIRKKYGTHKVDLKAPKQVRGIGSTNKVKLKNSLKRIMKALDKRPI